MSLAPVIHLPGMGPTQGPPTDAELGATCDEMPTCLCGDPVIDHADAPDLPCLDCTCEAYREDIA